MVYQYSRIDGAAEVRCRCNWLEVCPNSGHQVYATSSQCCTAAGSAAAKPAAACPASTAFTYPLPSHLF